VVAENKRSARWPRKRSGVSAVRAELQRLGVAKIDLAFKAVQDGIVRTEDGRLVARSDAGETPLKEHLAAFVNENPEFLPARIAGGTGMTATFKAPSTGRETVSIEQIRPGMSAEEMQRVREEIVRVASQTFGACSNKPARIEAAGKNNQVKENEWQLLPQLTSQARLSSW